jgi:hypothetical protein
VKLFGVRWRQPPLSNAAARRLAPPLWKAAALLPHSILLLAISANAQLIASGDRIAILDPVANQVRVVEGHKTTLEAKTNETPIDAVFLGDDLFVLERDARTLSLAGTKKSVHVAQDPAFVRESNGRLYVYSRATGVVEEITRDLRIERRVTVAPFASDFEIIGKTGYLVFPAEAKLRTFSVPAMKTTGEIAAGVVPVDLASAGGINLAIADPSAKRVWIIEGAQSMTQAVARGFLRGLLGLGLTTNRQSQFPTGVDRVLTRGSLWIAYDSSSGTLYRFTKNSVTTLAKGVAPGTFVLTDEGVAVWEGGTAFRLHK